MVKKKKNINEEPLDKNFDEQILTHFNIKAEPSDDLTKYIPELYGILPDGTRIFPRNEFTSPQDILESYYIGWDFKEKEPVFKLKKNYEKVFYRSTREELNPYFKGVFIESAFKAKQKGQTFLNRNELEIECAYKIFKRLECHKLMLLSSTNHFGFRTKGEPYVKVGDTKRNEIYRTALVIAIFQHVVREILIEDYMCQIHYNQKITKS